MPLPALTPAEVSARQPGALRLRNKALRDPRAIRLLAEHCPDLVTDRGTVIDAAALREKRIRTGLRVAAFAAEVGLSADHLRNVELGNKQLSPEALSRVATRLGIEPGELLTASAA